MLFHEQLHNDGVVVIPNLVQDARRTRESMCKDLRQMKGYTKRAHDRLHYVLGSFGALGNPQSFHLPTCSKLRRRATKLITELLTSNTCAHKDSYLQQLFDRVSVRQPGSKIPHESPHQDKSKDPDHEAQTFGGFVNLDSEPQVFRCAKGSHLLHRPKGPGFSRLSTAEAAKYKMVSIKVPPGSWIIFRQDIVHEVAKAKYKSHSFRLYLGFRLSKKPDALYPSNIEKIKFGLAPLLPSGQKPRIYSMNHGSALVKKITVPWCAESVAADLRTTTPAGHSVIPPFWFRSVDEELKRRQESGYVEYTDAQLQKLAVIPVRLGDLREGHTQNSKS
eukprot:GFYU01008250.1.p1 GENE.GFYU01008250.1~~GFYU01008250.1.p1  ORF type:complete len:333 (-),score=14.13 GFYU01008250.1:795-1793(-)